jgi:hypothetical protein
MASLLESLVPIVAMQLTLDEREHAIAYAIEAPIQAGAKLEMPGVTISFPAEAWLVFVDREPTANWGHSARYLVISRNGKDVRSIDTRLPPFRPEGGPTWRLIYQAPTAPDAAVAVPR